ncbi:MAG: arsenic metallochaperone ArsD family protein [Roseiarcus sp.]
MPKLLIFDPPQSCATGACSPDDEDASEKFEAFLAALREEGVEATRFNLGYHPKAFAENEIVKQTLAREGVDSLPLAIVDDVILTRGGYPTREALDRALGRTPPSAAPFGEEAN